MILLRREVGDVLRKRRQALGRTLRDVSASASVSLGYLSEIERGEKEPSSELVAAVCSALGLPLSAMLRDVATRLARAEELAAVTPSPVRLPLPTGETFDVNDVEVTAA